MRSHPIIPVLTKRKHVTAVILLILISCFSLEGQGRKELEDRRKRLVREIGLTTNLLNETTKNKEAAYDLFLTLQNQIHKRKQLVKTLREEVNYNAKNIKRTTEVIESLKTDIDDLKLEYGEMARRAYRLKLNNSGLFFLFSADGFNDAFKRWRYLKQYDQSRKKQANLIVETQLMLERKINNLENRIKEKEKLLQSEERQSKLLGQELEEKNQILKTLKSDESRLKKSLKSQEKDREGLDDAIKDIIRSEVAITKETKDYVNPSSESSKDLTTLFQHERGKLPWPVKKGVVTRRFGKQAHPTLKRIEISNNGIDIRADRKADVRSVFAGKVVGKTFVPGYNNMLIVQHGDYYTVYSNLDEVFVNKGDEVQAKTTIGKLSVDQKTNKSELHFEVWREKTRLNPADWVHK